MCKLVPADNNDPVFLICHGHVMKVLTYIVYTISKKIKRYLKRCKLNPSNYSSHSFRRVVPVLGISFKSSVRTNSVSWGLA